MMSSYFFQLSQGYVVDIANISTEICSVLQPKFVSVCDMPAYLLR